MKNILLICTLFFSSLNLYSQDNNNGWLINFEEAAKLSIKSGKPILANFTGSDWCGWCIRLNREVFVTPEFKDWASENVILLELDYPRRQQQTDEIKKQNRELQQFFQVRGYPTLHIFNVVITDGKTQITSLGKMGYLAGGPTPWIASANNYLKNK
ncbi:MAG: thioredoxin family protein [Flavobacteriales bacterium]|nr:thioredoxin family protein [Flavobacteriales bacterium]|tara:strand:- start:120 stop:587 length:468 start_codon:yes stop_codon:yes gene_type:complete